MNVQKNVYGGFYSLCLQFLESSKSAWPEDVLIPIAIQEFQKLDAKLAFDLFDATFGPFVEGLSKKSVETLYAVGDLPVVEALQIRCKYDGANTATRDSLWACITQICKFVAMQKLYQNIPSNILGAVNDAATGLKSKLDSGLLDVNNINPMELGKEVMAKFAPGELEKMMSEMTSNPETMASIMSQMTNILGSESISDVASAMSRDGSLDISKLMLKMPKSDMD